MKIIRIVVLMVVGALLWELSQLLWELGVFHAVNDFANRVGRWLTALVGWVVIIVIAILVYRIVVNVFRRRMDSDPEAATVSGSDHKSSIWFPSLRLSSARNTDRRRAREDKLAEEVKLNKSA
jgi:flagellar biosynthesis/type III secretory pathway M-ring protein FliF/YscJ